MTKAEFIAWLDGYLTSRDMADAELIREKLATVKEPAPLEWGKIGAPVFGMSPARLTSGDPMPMYRFTITDPTPVYYTPPSVARALADGMKPLGADFDAVWEANTDKLYQS